MRVMPMASVMLLLMLLAPALQAQVSSDPFDALHSDLMRAAQQELGLISPKPVAIPQQQIVVSEKAMLDVPWSNPALNRFQSLFPLMSAIFKEEGVPQEFLMVGLVESGYQTDAVSPANAVGIWQFIPATARRFGLMNDAEDLRTRIVLSTRAAARYLRFLLDQFDGDWQLTLAAYNAGEDRVDAAIRRGGTRDFKELAAKQLLPEETRNYVPAVLRAIAEARNLGLLATPQLPVKGNSND